MSQKPITMEQIKQILQLKEDGVAIREISRHTGISRNVIKKYLARFEASSKQDHAALSNKQLVDTAYDNEALSRATGRQEGLMKHFAYAEKEIFKTGVTRHCLWQEYKEQYPAGYNYSQYCYHFTLFVKYKDVVMHLEYDAGDMIMIDFAGKKLSYTVAGNGQVVPCEVFLGVLPYSGLVFCKAVHSAKHQQHEL